MKRRIVKSQTVWLVTSLSSGMCLPLLLNLNMCLFYVLHITVPTTIVSTLVTLPIEENKKAVEITFVRRRSHWVVRFAVIHYFPLHTFLISLEVITDFFRLVLCNESNTHISNQNQNEAAREYAQLQKD